MALYPEYLILFFLLVPVGYVLFLRYLQGRRELKRITGRLRDQSVYDVFLVKWFFSGLTFVFFIILTVLSLLGFPEERQIPEDMPEKSDIVFALDISYSMLAEDVTPTRLDRSVGIIKSVLDALPGQRYGLVVFKGSAAVLVPMTENAEAIRGVLGYVSPAMLTSTGTNLEAGIRKAVEMFPAGESRRRAILLFSDGEVQAGDGQAAAQEARRAGARTFAFAAGTPEGARIPLSDGSFVLNPQGEEHVTRLNRTLLEHIASTGGGRYFNTADPGVLPQATALLSEGMAFDDYGSEIRERYRPFLAGALMFLLIHMAIKIFPWRGSL